tara:strand:- start:6450 stop:6773 length:324 start_codon:yes stop_codon:yes gene_type:complete
MIQTPLILTNNGKGLRMSCAAVSSRAALVGTGDSLCISNLNGFAIYVVLGGSTIEADLTGFPILPGTKEDNIVLDAEKHAAFYANPYIAVICESGLSGYLSVHRVSR